MSDSSPPSESRAAGEKVFVITGPSGVGKGTLIAELLARLPELELSISATTREPREGEVDGRDYHFLAPEEFDRRADAKDFLEFATYSGHRYGTLRSEVERRLAVGRSVVLEIEVQGARQVRAAMPESIQVFIAPPEPSALGAASRPGGPTPPRRSTPAWRSLRRSWPPRTSLPIGSSTTIASAPRTSWSGSCAGSWPRAPASAVPYTRRPDDQASRRQTARPHRLPLRGRRRGRQACPPDQQLLPQPRRGQLRRVPAADGRDPGRQELPLDLPRGAR